MLQRPHKLPNSLCLTGMLALIASSLSHFSHAGGLDAKWQREMAVARTWDDVALAQNRFLRELYLLSRLAREAGDSDTMLAAMGEIAQHSLLDVEARLDLASAQLDHGSVDAARAAFRSVLEVDSEEIRALRLLSTLAADEGAVEKAAEYRARAERAKLGDENAHLKAAGYFQVRLLEEEAEAECERVLAMFPHNSSPDGSALTLLAQWAAAAKDYVTAAALHDRALACQAARGSPVPPHDHRRQLGDFYRALASIEQGQESSALPLFEEMLQQCKSDYGASRRLGDRFFSEEMYQLAVRAYERARERRPTGMPNPREQAAYEVLERRLDVARELAQYEKPRRKMPEKEARKFLAAFGKVRWMKDDPHQPARWFAIEGQFVWLDDHESLQLEPFPELQAAWGLPLDVSAIAFSPAQVWAATNVGLLCFEREARQWTQRIVPGVKEDAAASDVQYEDGKIRVTVGGKECVLDVE